MKKEYSAGVFVFDKSSGAIKYLVLKYAGGHWDLPKGHIEAGETRKNAALRELKEETGLHALLLPDFEHSFSYFFRSKTGELISKTVYFYIGQALDHAITLSAEHVDFAWLTYHDALDRLTFENAKDLLVNVNKFLMRAG